jgi:hypothetical protein
VEEVVAPYPLVKRYLPRPCIVGDHVRRLSDRVPPDPWPKSAGEAPWRRSL